MDRAMSETELVSYLAEQIHSAMNEDGNEVSTTRQENLDYYLGELYGNEREGYSTFRTREVLETVEWALPSIMRVFTSGENVVQFEPVGPEDEAQAEQETDCVNDSISRQDDYFMHMHSWFKSALIDPVAYARVFMDTRTEAKWEEYSGLTEMELAEIIKDEEVEVEEQAQRDIPVSVMTEMGPQMTMTPVFDIKIKRTVKHNELRVESVPGEETLVSADCTSLNLDDAKFVCHRTKKTFTYLVQEGYDRKLLEAVSPDSGEEYGGEAANRLYTSDESWEDDDEESLRTFWVNDISALVDFDGDGIAERRHIVMIGDKIHVNEPYDYQPYVSLASVMMPHRHVGLSLADLVKDLQLLKSTLVRQLLDNMYRNNRPRTKVGINALLDDGKTMQALLDPLSEFIPCEDPNAIMTDVQTSQLGEILPVIQHVTDSQQTRTGIAPNLSLDPAVIQQSTMGAFSGALEQASQRVEMIARTFAETGFKWMIKKAHRLLKEHSQRPIMMKRRGKWIETDPSDWRDRRNVSINIGLGFNDKAKELALFQGILAIQKEALQIGLATPNHIFNTLDDMVAASGRKSAERYFQRPQEGQQQQQQPDPALLIAQAQAEAMKMDAQSKIMRAQVEAQKAQIEAEKAQVEAQRIIFEAQQAANKARTEADIAIAQARADIQNTVADTGVKEAQRIKLLAEVRGINLESDAVEEGVVDFLDSAAQIGGQNGTTG